MLASRRYAHEQHWRSWRNLLIALALYAGAIAGAVAPLPIWIRTLCSGLAGLLMVRMFILYHDHQHGNILRCSRLADAIMWCIGLLTLNPPTIWNRSHDHHHHHTAKIFGADIGSYPVMTTAAFVRANRRQRLAYIIARHPITMALGYVTVFIYGMCFRSMLTNPRQHWDSALCLLLHASLIILLAWWSPLALVLGVIAPFAIASALGAYLFYAQHNFPGVILQPRADWDYVTAALHSSSMIRMNPIMHWFTGNIGYHHVHHLNSRIPFYRLPEAMAGMPELQSPITTSLSPLDIFRCLRLKLWDSNKSTMVPFTRGRSPL